MVGGEGLRGPLDTPDVDLRFGHLSEEAMQKPDEKPLEEELETMADDHFEKQEIDPDDEVAYMKAGGSSGGVHHFTHAHTVFAQLKASRPRGGEI